MLKLNLVPSRYTSFQLFSSFPFAYGAAGRRRPTSLRASLYPFLSHYSAFQHFSFSAFLFIPRPRASAFQLSAFQLFLQLFSFPFQRFSVSAFQRFSRFSSRLLRQPFVIRQPRWNKTEQNMTRMRDCEEGISLPRFGLPVQLMSFLPEIVYHCTARLYDDYLSILCPTRVESYRMVSGPVGGCRPVSIKT
jgi:hypothetical protein